METIAYKDFQSFRIGVVVSDQSITRLTINQTLPIAEATSPLHDSAFAQLDEYFRGERHDFNLPLNPSGSTFQKQVWRALCQIPYGKTTDYEGVAALIANPKACRAVGNANSKNPIPIIIPCHRVIRKSGALGGYTGGLDIKIALLDLEREFHHE